jgi:drug/metabolite transporter (DMT)-like permease
VEERVKGSRGAVLATVGSALLWGSSFAVIKIGLGSIDPYWFAFLRFAIASLVALLVMAALGELREVGLLLRSRLVLLLGLTNAVGFILQFKGQTMTSAGNAALLVNSSTIYVALASHFFLRERFGTLKILAVVIGVVGVALVTTGGRPSLDLGGNLRGNVFVLFAAFIWTAFILLDKKIVANHDVDMRALTAAMVTVTAVAALPAALVFGHGAFPRPWDGFWTVPYTAVFCTVAPFFLWSWGLRRISATTSSVLMLSEVIFALILAGIILGERLSGGAIVGSGLIIGAAVLASRETGSELASGPDVVPE